MPRVHKRKARKDYPHGYPDKIKKGQTYYTWKFRHSSPHRSLTAPLPEQLTQSPYYQELYLLERVQSDFDGTADEARKLAELFRELGNEQRDKKDNMPKSLQYSETADLLEERSEECEQRADAIELAADSLEEWESDHPDFDADMADADDDDANERDTVLDEVRNAE